MDVLNEIGDGLICPAIAFVRDGALLIGHRHYRSDKWKEISVWTIPGGRSEEGERIEETLRREVAEEVDIAEFRIAGFLGKMAGAKEGDIVYLFRGETEEEPRLMEPEKFSEWKWQPLDAMPEDYINREQISLIKRSLEE